MSRIRRRPKPRPQQKTQEPIHPAPTEGDSFADRRTYFKKHPLNNIVVISNHAIDRYRERFRPELDNLGCRRVLYGAMRARGRFTPVPPEWLYSVAGAKQRISRANVGYILIDDLIALPLRRNEEKKVRDPSERQPRPFIAVTCLSADPRSYTSSSLAAVRAGEVAMEEKSVCPVVSD
jgi:hypothetical protein